MHNCTIILVSTEIVSLKADYTEDLVESILTTDVILEKLFELKYMQVITAIETEYELGRTSHGLPGGNAPDSTPELVVDVASNETIIAVVRNAGDTNYEYVNKLGFIVLAEGGNTECMDLLECHIQEITSSFVVKFSPSVDDLDGPLIQLDPDSILINCSLNLSFCNFE